LSHSVIDDIAVRVACVSLQPAARQEGAAALQREPVVLRRLHQPRSSSQAAATAQRQARASRVR